MSRRRSLPSRVAALELASVSDRWEFTLENGRTVKVSFEAVLNVFLGGLEIITDAKNPGDLDPKVVADLKLLAQVDATTEKSMLGRGVVAAAKDARERVRSTDLLARRAIRVSYTVNSNNHRKRMIMQGPNVPYSIQEHKLDLAKYPDKINAIHRPLVDALTKLESDQELSREGKDKRAADLRDQARNSLEGLRREAERHRTAIDEWVEQPRTADVNAQLLAEQKQARAWQRAARQLDSGANVDAIVDTAIEAKDFHALRAMQDELPSYVAAGAGPMASIGHEKTMERIKSAVVDAMPEGQEKQAATLRAWLGDFWPHTEQTLDSVATRIDRLQETPQSELRKAAIQYKVNDGAIVRVPGE